MCSSSVFGLSKAPPGLSLKRLPVGVHQTITVDRHVVGGHLCGTVATATRPAPTGLAHLPLCLTKPSTVFPAFANVTVQSEICAFVRR